MRTENEQVKTHSTQQAQSRTKKGGETRTKTTSRTRTSERSRIIHETIQMPSTHVVVYRHEFPKMDFSKLEAKLNISPTYIIKTIMVLAAVVTIREFDYVTDSVAKN